MPGRYEQRTWPHDPTIHAPARYRRACGYKVFLPDQLSGLPISLEGEVAGLVVEAEQMVRALDASRDVALEPLSRLLLRTEAIASSRVEGMQVATADLARAEVRRGAGRRVGVESREILGNIDAMQHAIEDCASANEVEVSHICAIHRRLMGEGERSRIAGVLRTGQNWIGGNDYNPCGADFVPPPAELVTPLLEDLTAAINDDRLPAVVQAALVHAQFETIHPFDDGNGRTGRALIHVVLRRRGVAARFTPPLSVVLAASRNRYVAGLSGFRGADVVPRIEWFAASLHRAAGLAASYVVAVAKLAQGWRTALERASPGLRADATEWLVLATLPGFPVVSGPMLRDAIGRSEPSVLRAVEVLRRAGVLQLVTEGSRNRLWQPVGLMELIEGLESGRTPN